METTRKEKVISVGITEELKDLLNTWTGIAEKQIDEENEVKENKKVGIEAKQKAVDIVRTEMEKIEEEFNKGKLDDNEWFKLTEKLNKLTDIVRWF